MTDTPDWTGERLRTARLARGWSQHELADRIGAGVRSVWRWENGQSRPRGGHIHMLEQLFQTHPPLIPARLAESVRLQCRGCAELTKLVIALTQAKGDTRKAS